MQPGTTTCIRCGLTGYDIAQRTGRTRLDGSPGVSQLCRWCYADPTVRAELAAEARRVSKRDSMRRQRAQVDARKQERIEAGTVLGPAPCRHCGTPLRWTGLEWRNSRGRRHSCARAA